MFSFKNRRSLLLVLLAGGLFVLISCYRSTAPPVSFYYWKTTFNLSSKESETLNLFKSPVLYLRYFDVDRIGNKWQILGEVRAVKPVEKNLEIVPVVFITARSFINQSGREIDSLALQVANRIVALNDVLGISSREWQIDCDWTDNGRENYFRFLSRLKSINGAIKLSCTIRLHQVKYFHRTGVPPVQQGVVMCYNMGKLRKTDRNSIFNREDAALYLPYLSAYPLPYKLALPIFSWTKQLRKGEVLDLIRNPEVVTNLNRHHFSITAKRNYKVLNSFFAGGIYFKQGDLLVKEQLSVQELNDAIEQIAGADVKRNQGIILFDLDETNLKHYTYETLSHSLAAFN